MKIDKSIHNGQEFIKLTTSKDHPKKFVVLNGNTEEQYENNPGMRELVLYKINGKLLEPENRRFCLAVRSKGSNEITRLEVSYDRREKAEAGAYALSNLYDEVWVLDVDYKKSNIKILELDQESVDRDYYEDNGFRRPGGFRGWE